MKDEYSRTNHCECLLILSFLFYHQSSAHLIAGKGIEAKKINDAAKRSVVVANLQRLQKLLLGQLTFEGLSQLNRLTAKDFKAGSYEPAGPPAPAPTQATTTASALAPAQQPTNQQNTQTS